MSESRIVLQSRTNDVEKLFKFAKRFQKRPLFNVVRYKVSVLFTHAEQRNIYAYVWLLQIKIKLMKLLDKLEEGIEKFEGAIKRFSGSIDVYRFRILQRREFVFSNSLQRSLIEVLQKYDRLTCLILLANRLDLFHSRELFFNAKSKYRNHCLKIFGEIIDLRTRDLPEVLFEDYLHNSRTYQKACKNLGEIDPQKLFNAIHLIELPFLDATEMEGLEGELQRMMRLGRS